MADKSNLPEPKDRSERAAEDAIQQVRSGQVGTSGAPQKPADAPADPPQGS